MVREDLISSAVSFLQDPSVSNAPLEKKIAFLQSKNLTQEEVDAALARSGDASTTSAPVAPPPTSQPPPQYAYRQPVQYAPQYPAQGYWQQPPPELPKRDWRDWFIMATVMGGVGYGLYVTAKRYVVPLIAPPTPPQLTADKDHVDESLKHINALLEQLSADTEKLKSAEDARTTRLDAALAEVESVLASVKESGRAREDDARRLADDVRGLRDLVPLAIERNKEGQENRLRELGNEVKGLKTLIGNRFGSVNTAASNSTAAAQSASKSPGPGTVLGSNPPISGTAGSAGAGSTMSPPSASPSAPSATNGEAKEEVPGQRPSSASSNPYGRLTNGKAAIPAWQLAASKKPKVEDESKEATS